MSWYRGSIITDAEGHPRVNYRIAFNRLLSKIHQLEEDHVKVVSKIDLNTNKLVEGELELLLKRYKYVLDKWIMLLHFLSLPTKYTDQVI